MSTDDEIFGPQTYRFPVPYDLIIHEKEKSRCPDEEIHQQFDSEDEYIAHLEDAHGPSIIDDRNKYRYFAPLNMYSILTVGTLTIDQADSLFFASQLNPFKLDKIKEVRVDLAYPLSRKVTVVIRPMLARIPSYNEDRELEIEEIGRITVGLILWQVALAYRAIYEQELLAEDDGEPGPFGVWGHNLGDLVYEGIDIFEDGYCRLFIGS